MTHDPRPGVLLGVIISLVILVIVMLIATPYGGMLPAWITLGGILALGLIIFKV